MPIFYKKIDKGKTGYSFFQNLIAGLIGMMLFFGIAESALRLLNFKYSLCENIFTISRSKELTTKYFASGCIPNTALYIELKPNFKGEMWATPVTINSRGFRDREDIFLAKKDKKDVRVICLGDSSTFGVKVDIEDTYAKKLERILNDNIKSGKHEVLNAGCAGYTSFNGLLMFKAKNLLAYKPDIVTIYFGLNDEFMWNSPNDANGYKIRTFNKNFQNSKLFSLFSKIVIEKVLRNNFCSITHSKEVNLRVTPRQFEQNLKNINEILKNHKIKGLFMTYPFIPEQIPYGVVSEARMDLYNNIIRQASKKYGFSLLDLEKIFRGKYNGDKRLFADFCHPSPYGHKIIAEGIYKKLFEY